MARERLSAVDIDEELGAQPATYERYMALQHKKIARGRFEAVILPIAEAAEDLARLRFSNALQKLFSLSKSEIGLLESELSAPGCELAYIAAGKARFS